MNILEKMQTIEPEFDKNIVKLVADIRDYDGMTAGKQLIIDLKKAGITLPKVKEDIIEIFVSVKQVSVKFIEDRTEGMPEEYGKRISDIINKSVNEITKAALKEMEIIYDHSKQEILDSIASELNITLDENMKGPLWLAYLKGIGLTDDQYRRELNVVEIEML